MHDLFLCYSTNDRELAKWLVEQLKKAGLSVWWDEEQIESRGEHVRRMIEGLAECRGLVALLTPSFVDSPWVPKELFAALVVFHGMSERFPGLQRNILLAAADSGAKIPDECCAMLGLEDHLHDARLQRGLQHLHVYAAHVRKMVHVTRNALIFPVYPDDLAGSQWFVNHSAAMWHKANYQTWKDAFGADIPKPSESRRKSLKALWRWILPLRRYCSWNRRSAIRCLDEFREQSGGEPIEPIEAFHNPNPMMRAIRNLWENRNISLVLHEERAYGMRSLASNPLTVTPHFGNPTDVVIGITNVERSGFVDLENAYRTIRSTTSIQNDLFDLSVLAALIVGYEKWFTRLTRYRDVEKRILLPLLAGERLGDEYY